jgi:hypothetical protein
LSQPVAGTEQPLKWQLASITHHEVMLQAECRSHIGGVVIVGFSCSEMLDELSNDLA